jgi:hypothetical protein
MDMPMGPFCQSCGMPMQKDEDFGTEVDGAKSEKYCTYCYQGGEFTNPEATMAEMIELSAKGWSESDPNMTYEQACEETKKIIPNLERWRET